MIAPLDDIRLTTDRLTLSNAERVGLAAEAVAGGRTEATPAQARASLDLRPA